MAVKLAVIKTDNQLKEIRSQLFIIERKTRAIRLRIGMKIMPEITDEPAESIKEKNLTFTNCT